MEIKAPGKTGSGKHMTIMFRRNSIEVLLKGRKGKGREDYYSSLAWIIVLCFQ